MRVDKCIMSFLLISVFLNLTTGCYYYKVNTKTDLIPEDIRWEDFNGKYLIIHHGDSAWQMNRISIDSSSLHCSISALPDNHKMYLKTNPEKSNQYTKSVPGSEGDVLDEVHIYTSGPVSINDTSLSADFSTLDRMEIYLPDKKKTGNSVAVPILIVLGAAAVVFCIVVIIALATKSSCPYVYTYDGGSYRFAGEIYSGAIYASLERNDYLPLPGFEPYQDNYTVKIANQLPEIQYINEAELWIVNHPGNTSVLADKNGVVHTLTTLQAPVKAISSGGTDLEMLLSEIDQQLFFFNEEPAVTGDTSAKNSVLLTFDVPPGQDIGKLVVNAKNSFWGDYIFGEFTKYFGKRYGTWVKKQGKLPAEKPIQWKKNQALPLMVYLETGDGWQFVDYFDMAGPLAFREMVMPVDLTDGLKKDYDSISQVRIKIETGFIFWELDYAAMDFSSETYTDILILDPFSATSESGKDVKKAITADDGDYYVQRKTGNEVVMDFKCPPERQDAERSLILHTKGYYTHVRNYSGPPDMEQIQAFRRPGKLSEFSLERYLEEKASYTMKSSRENQ
ncbi:MAG: hypothetical protein MUC31_02165 [Bacteroidales bacterium]|jgi:hypothetical protein|nr:hypothetical protein [Bacteroidales bacterium]